MKKLSKRQKRHLINRSKVQLRKKKRSRKFRLNKIRSNSFLRNRHIQLQNIEREKSLPRSVILRLNPPTNYSLLENPSEVISFIFDVKKYASKNYVGYDLIIDLEHIVKIDIGSISLLLSVVDELSYYKVKVTGTFPLDDSCRTIFEDSGFLAHMRSISGSNVMSFKGTKNLMVKRGRDRTKNKKVGETIKQAMELLTGKKQHYPPIFSIVQEVNGNSVEHAYMKNSKEHWLFSINYDESNGKVIFCFVDNGYGILSTLYRRYTKRFFETLKLTSDGEILKGAYLKKYSSRHEKQLNRNKGLPLLKKIQDKGSVENLMVLTNRVFLHLGDFKPVTLKREFSGTFYYWELGIENFKTWSQKRKA